MDRRRFLESSLLTVGGLALGPGAGSVLSGREVLPDSIEHRRVGAEYIRAEAPRFEIPPYHGTSYEDTIPDTFDVAERAKLGINCLTGIADPDAEYEIFWMADFFRNPPIMYHDFSDWCQNVEGMIESLPLLRLATGSDLNNQVDRAWMETLLKSVGPDGLVYIPLNGRAWGRQGAAWVTPVWRTGTTTTDPSDKSVSQVTGPEVWPRAMAAMTISYLRDRNPMWKQTIEQGIERMLVLASDEGDYTFFPAGGFEPNVTFGGGMVAGEQLMPTGYLALDGGNARVIQGLAQFYRVTGHEPARILAEKLVRYIRFHADCLMARAVSAPLPLKRTILPGRITPRNTAVI